MGVKNLPHITRNLMENGMAKDTPVGLVRWGTTTRQESVFGTLENIVERVRAAGLKAPSIIVVGDVVNLRGTLKWFENRPLLGRRIVVTRAREQASDLVRRLTDMGADCLECPTIAVTPPDDWQPLDAAIGNLAAYDWIVFTSVNGVKFFFRRLFETGHDVRTLHRLRTACIGPVTAQTLLTYGLRTDILPENYRAESVVEAFRREEVSGRRILLPRAREARPVLPVELTRMGAVVDEVAAYQTVQARENAGQLVEDLRSGSIDMVTFTSSSTVKNFKALLPEGEPIEAFMNGVTVASIGPITSDTARELGFTVDITASAYTIPGLCDAILAHYQAG
jgi:uroporphyrinogen III methyltransferase/synthase